jgi:hypothetical protein
MATIKPRSGPHLVRTGSDFRWQSSESSDATSSLIGLCTKAFGLLLLGGDMAQAFFEGGDFAEPLHAAAFG